MNKADITFNFLNYFQNCSTCGSLVVIENPFPVIWGHVSIVEADLVCIDRLLEENKGKYNLSAPSPCKKFHTQGTKVD